MFRFLANPCSSPKNKNKKIGVWMLFVSRNTHDFYAFYGFFPVGHYSDGNFFYLFFLPTGGIKKKLQVFFYCFLFLAVLFICFVFFLFLFFPLSISIFFFPPKSPEQTRSEDLGKLALFFGIGVFISSFILFVPLFLSLFVYLFDFAYV